MATAVKANGSRTSQTSSDALQNTQQSILVHHIIN